MRKTTTAALALAAILAVGGGLAIAQQAQPGPGPGGPGGPGMERGERGWFGRRAQSPEMMQRMLDGKLAGAKAALRLTAEQEKLWPTVEQMVREMAAKRMTMREEMRGRMREAREQGKRPDMIEMLERGSQRAADRASDMKKMAETLKPLYATLSDEQKQVLGQALRQGRGMRGHHGGWMGRG